MSRKAKYQNQKKSQRFISIIRSIKRYYDPYTGRFISEDSYWGEDSNPLSLNLYTYGYNNPVMYVDPSGHFPGLSSLIGLGKKILGSISGSRDDEESKEEQQESSNNVTSSSDVPAWLDWDGDGVVDSREDRDDFDKNNDRVADWIQDDTDQDWVYNSESGWDQNNGNSNTNSGPTAEDIREAYDYAASKMSDASQSYASVGIPNYDTFDKIAERLSGFDSSDRMSKNSNSNKSNTVRISAMQMHATDGGASYGDEYYDTYMSIHAEEYFAAKKREELLEEAIQKSILITSSFEGSGYVNITGNFDDQGLSMGILQWNIGQGTLQPLLSKMVDRNPELTKEIFGENYNTLVTMLNNSQQDQMKWAISINENGKIVDQWENKLVELSKTTEFEEIQNESMSNYINSAIKITEDFNLKTERGLALAFDIAVQNGSIKSSAEKAIESKIEGKQITEKELLNIIANEVANASNPRWKNDVLSRKMTIANGTGKVHGKDYDLEKEFNLSDTQIRWGD